MPYKGGGYKRKGVVYEGPTRPRGRKPKAVVLTPVAPVKPISSKVKNYVKSAISREIETKYAQVNVYNQQVTTGMGLNSTSTPLLGLNPTATLIPSITNGTGESDRIGNKIHCKGIYVKYSLRAIDVTSGGSNDNPFRPFLARVVIYSKKLNKEDKNNVGILNNGSSSTNFGSAPETWLEPYNTDVFTIHYSKQFKMVPAKRATGQTAPNQWAQDAVSEGHKSFILKRAKLKNIPKVFLYNDAASATPQNVACYMAVCVCNEDGTGNNVVTDQRLMVNADAQIYYKDA